MSHNSQFQLDDSASKTVSFAASLPAYVLCAANDTHIAEMMAYPHENSVAVFETERPRQEPTSHSLHWIMRSLPASQILPDQQLMLAVRLAEAVLQYYATPWLKACWRLNQIFLEVEDPSEDYHLETLHLVLDRGENVQDLHATDGVYAVSNGLFYLAVALIEVALWKPLESVHNFHSCGIVETARRLALSPFPLGPRYGKMIQNCLTFGRTGEFSGQMLQHHIASQIIEPLQDIITAITI